MKKIVIETKVPKWKIEKVIRKYCIEGTFFVTRKRSQLYVYFSKHIDEKTVFSMAKDLSMEVVSMKARAILRH